MGGEVESIVDGFGSQVGRKDEKGGTKSVFSQSDVPQEGGRASLYQRREEEAHLSRGCARLYHKSRLM